MDPVQVSLLMRVGAQENPQARKTTVIGAIAAAGHHSQCFCLFLKPLEKYEKNMTLTI